MALSSLTVPIVLIDDDEDDQEMIKEAISRMGLPNHLRIFSTCVDGFGYLMQTEESPMIIISDVNLPLMTGLDFKRKVDSVDRLRKKAIPFVFLSTASNARFVDEAYLLQAQGYFLKPNSILDLHKTIELIFSYWKVCLHPKN